MRKPLQAAAEAGIVVPAYVTEIGPRAFANSPNLRAVEFLTDEFEYYDGMFEGCGPLTVYGHNGSSAQAAAEASEGVSFVCLY